MGKFSTRIATFELGGCLVNTIFLLILLSLIGFGQLIHIGLVLLGMIILLPVVGWFGLRWWLKRNIVESACPACNYQFIGFEGRETICPSCGESLLIEKGKFRRTSSLGTIDVEVVDVEN